MGDVGLHLAAYSRLETKKNAGSSVHRLHGYAMLMSPNSSEIAVHGCLCPGDMVVRPCKVMAISRSWYVCFSADIGIVE